MGAENIQFMTSVDIRRVQESARIKYLGGVVLAASTLRLKDLNLPEADIENYRAVFSDRFSKNGRRAKVEILKQQECVFQKTGPVLNGGASESSAALHSRRLSLISQIVKEGIAEDVTAVDAVDLYMGRLCLDLNNLQLVKIEKPMT